MTNFAGPAALEKWHAESARLSGLNLSGIHALGLISDGPAACTACGTAYERKVRGWPCPVCGRSKVRTFERLRERP